MESMFKLISEPISNVVIYEPELSKFKEFQVNNSDNHKVYSVFNLVKQFYQMNGGTVSWDKLLQSLLKNEKKTFYPTYENYLKEYYKVIIIFDKPSPPNSSHQNQINTTSSPPSPQQPDNQVDMTSPPSSPNQVAPTRLLTNNVGYLTL